MNKYLKPVDQVHYEYRRTFCVIVNDVNAEEYLKNKTIMWMGAAFKLLASGYGWWDKEEQELYLSVATGIDAINLSNHILEIATTGVCKVRCFYCHKTEITFDEKDHCVVGDKCMIMCTDCTANAV